MAPRFGSSLTRAKFVWATALPLSGSVKPTISGVRLSPIAQQRIRRRFGPCSRRWKQRPHTAKPPRRNWWQRVPPRRSISPRARSTSYVTDRRPRDFVSMRRASLRAGSRLVAAPWPAVILAQTSIDLRYSQHDRNRPQPMVVVPSTPSSQETPGRPPSDAVVLFDGRDLSKWRQKDGSVAKWKLGVGYFTVRIRIAATAACFCMTATRCRYWIHTRARPTPMDRRAP